MDYDLIIIAGEPSGDEHASQILKELKKSSPHLKIAAVCGPHMKKAYPLDEILNINQLSIMGFVDVIKNMVKLYRLYKLILNFILNHPAKIILFVDYPGMNLKLAKTLRKKNYSGKLFHFIAPTAWAWKKKRVFDLKASIDKLFCILPFEEAFFKSYDVAAEFVGHPLMIKLKHELNTSRNPENLIALFPGSRVHEIHKNLPLMLQACHDLIKDYSNLRIGISVARPELINHIFRYLSDYVFKEHIEYFDSSSTIRLMKQAQLAIAKSGTCNLELALLGTPTIVVYAISKLDLWIATKIFKINLPFYSLPNLILNKKMFDELYGPNLNLENLKHSINQALTNPQTFLATTHELRETLSEKDPGKVIAQEILRFL
jgi:lipid-A-disaccharide synthase